MTVENAVARSISHTEVVACEFVGEFAELQSYVADTFANGSDAVLSEENDGTIDVADIDGDWRIKVTLTAAYARPASDRLRSPNEDRAASGKELVDAHYAANADEYGLHPSEPIVDVIANILHYAASLGLNAVDLAQTATDHFNEERD